jgi:prevent-host-death family protein
MKTYEVKDARENFDQVLAVVAKGEDVVITENGKEIAVVTSLDILNVVNEFVDNTYYKK